MTHTTSNVVYILLTCYFVSVAGLIAIKESNPPTNAPTIDHKTSRVEYVMQHIFVIPKTITDDKEEIKNLIPIDEIGEPIKNFLDWYQDGVSSYLANDWSGCVENLELAIKGYQDFYAATASCRIQCSGVARQVAPFFEDDIDDLQFYESAVRRTLCLIKCKRLLMPTLPEFFHMNKWSQDVFITRKPFTYLQLCYFRVSVLYSVCSVA